MFNNDSLILQIEEKEINILKSKNNEAKGIFSGLGVGTSRNVYIMLEIFYEIKDFKDYNLYSNFHLDLQGENNHLNQDLFLKYYGVYANNLNNFYLVYENFGKSFVGYVKEIFSDNLGESININLLMKQIYEICLKFSKEKFQAYLNTEFLFIHGSSIRYLNLGNVYKPDGILMTIPYLINNFNFSNIIEFFVGVLIFTCTGEEKYINSPHVFNKLTENQMSLIPLHFQRFLKYFNDDKSKPTVESHIEYLNLIFTNLKIKENKIFKINNNNPNDNNLKTRGVDRNFFFDKMVIPDIGEEEMVEINFNKNENYLRNVILPKFYKNEFEFKSGCGSKSGCSYSTSREVIYNINEVGQEKFEEIFIDEIKIGKINDNEKEKFRMKLLGFMYRNFPKGTQNEYVYYCCPENVYFKEFLQEYKDNCINKNQFPNKNKEYFLRRKRIKEIAKESMPIVSLDCSYNKLLNFKNEFNKKIVKKNFNLNRIWNRFIYSPDEGKFL
jgi:hypothetical protein